MSTKKIIHTAFIFAVIILVTSCGSKSITSDHHNHDSHAEHDEGNHAHNQSDENIIERHTIYTNSLELFVTFSPLVRNKTNRITAHITRLNDYKADTKGTISLYSGMGDKSSDVKESEPGIYLMDFSPKKSGKMYLKFTYQSKDVETVFLLKGIMVHSSEHDIQHIQMTTPEGVEFTKEQSWKINFAVEKIEPKHFAGIIHTSGKIEQSPGSDYAITANHSGIVNFKQPQISEGSDIKKNQLLMTIKGSDMIEDNIQTEYIAAKTNFIKYKNDYDRAKKLFDEKLITEKDYLDVKLSYEQAANSYNSFSRNYKEGGSDVIAPANGFIKQLKVLAGEYVESGQILTVISQSKKLVIKADVSQKDFGKLSSIKSVLFRTNYSPIIHNSNLMNGKLLSYSKSTGDSYFTSIYFEVDNKGDLVQGAYIDAFLHCKESNLSLSVPVSAILDEQGQKYVFVQLDGEHYEKRYVQTATFDGERVKITNGLKAGEYVVYKGAYQIKLASVSGSLPAHGHVH